jgi:microcin C transport system substrate-binding protein
MRRQLRRCNGLRRMVAGLAIAGLTAGAAPSAQPRDDVITLSTAPQPPVGYKYLPYVNPNAPKGGAFTYAYEESGDFDNLNPFILKGTAPDSMLEVWQPLFKGSDIDSVTSYHELARSCDISPDGLTVTFHLEPAARFSDGTKVTARDVVWTYNTLITQGSPVYAGLYAGVASATAPDDETVVFKLQPGAGADVPINLSGMYVLPEHFWKGRNFADPLMDFPVGSGAYQVSKVSYGNYITYKHVKNWWAAHDPSDIGFYNFDTFTERFYQNDSVSLQAFKAGQVDARDELAAKVWATAYDFPAVRDGQVKLERVPESLPGGMYGLQMNTRRPVFSDPRVRQAMALAFDFQWMNRVLFYGSYNRITSYFSKSPMASSGLPSPAELKLLNPFRGKIPDAVFTTPFSLPVTDGSGYNLPQLEAAMKLLNQAGWHVKNFKLVNAAGEQMSFEMLFDDDSYDRIAISYAADLKLLGIDAQVRATDQATYERRMNDFDFDMTENAYPETDFPGTEQADYWGCAAADTPGSNNWSGVCSPAIDAMINAELAARTPADKQTAIHALDRLLLNGWYFVPWWGATSERMAWWQDRVVKQAAPLQVGFDYDLWWHK